MQNSLEAQPTRPLPGGAIGHQGYDLRPLQGPLAWDQADFDDPGRYIVHLNQEDVKEIDEGLQTCLDHELDPDEINPLTFPLPTVQQKLQECANTIHEGRGFCVLRGLGTDHTVEDGLLIFLGLASYIGDKRGLQNKQGHMLSHITDFKAWTAPRQQRHGIHSNGSLPFHTDMGTDILALQVRATAAKGGQTFISPAWTIYNDLLREPHHLHVLFEPNWPIQISKRQARTTCIVRSLLDPDWPAPKTYYIMAPLLQFHEGRLMVSVDPARLGPQNQASGSEGVPELTEAQVGALEALRQAAWRHQICIQAKPGDIVLINNWSTLHRRDSYSDGEKSRHFVRLWLRNSELGWSVPDSMSIPWLAAYGDDPIIDRYYPVQPLDTYPIPKYSVGSAAFILDESDEEGDAVTLVDR